MRKLLLLLLVHFPYSVFSQIPQPLPNTYVNDFAHVLTDEQITALNQNIAQIEKASTVQFAIVLIDKLPDNYTIEDYTLLLARKWHVGTNKNGLVYVAAISDHKQRIEKASGLDSVFTQQKRLDILNSIKPFFKIKDYYGGLQILVSQVSSILKATPSHQSISLQQQMPVQKLSYANDIQDDGDSSVFWIVGGAFIFIIIVLIIANNRRRRMNGPVNYNGNIDPNYPNGPPSGGGGGFFLGAVLGALGLWGAQNIQDDLSNHQGYNGNDNVDNGSQDNNDNDSSSWGNWSGGDSSSDSGFSSSDSDSGSSSDW